MDEHAGDTAAAIGEGAAIAEYGSGSSRKTGRLLAALDRPAAYIPIDISCDMLAESARRIDARFEALEVLPVCADYTRTVDLPAPEAPVRRWAAYFPGSTIGNFHPAEAVAFLRHVAETLDAAGNADRPGGLLIGVDLAKDRATLEAAYDDAAGVTAAFNLNVLRRLNRELGARFDLDAFEHRAVYNEDAGRVEMHLVSPAAQAVRLDGRTTVAFEAGETIRTECSYKYAPADFEKLAEQAGWRRGGFWTDRHQRFSVQYFVRARKSFAHHGGAEATEARRRG